MGNKELDRIEQEIEAIKTQNAITVNENKESQEGILNVIDQQQTELVKSKEFQEISKKFGEERIKSELAEEASKIREKNQQTAERVFETETKELRLKHCQEQLKREHKYNMETLDRDAKHKQMLDKRRKLVEKYGYLYDCSPQNLMVVKDGKNEDYNVPKDFMGTYIPVQLELLVKEYMSYEKALNIIANSHYDILQLREDICYSQVRFSDGYAVKRKDFARSKRRSA